MGTPINLADQAHPWRSCQSNFSRPNFPLCWVASGVRNVLYAMVGHWKRARSARTVVATSTYTGTAELQFRDPHHSNHGCVPVVVCPCAGWQRHGTGCCCCGALHGAARRSHADARALPLACCGGATLTAGKLKAHELRSKGKQELLKQLDGLKAELAMVRCCARRAIAMDGAHASPARPL